MLLFFGSGIHHFLDQVILIFWVRSSSFVGQVFFTIDHLIWVIYGITSTLPFGNSNYVTKGQTNDYRVLQLEKNSQGTLSSEEFFKNKFFILEVKIPPDLGENKF